MPRKRSDTIGDLGRLPARPSSVAIPIPPPLPPAAPEKGAVARWFHGALFDNVGLKFLSIVLAVTVFLLVSTDKDREITVHMRVSYTMPEDRVLVAGRLDDVRVTVKGPQRLLRKFDEHNVDPINLDLREAVAGDVSITPDLVHLPRGLSVVDLTPRVVRVAFDKLTEKTVPIAPDMVGTPKHGYWVSELKTQPATARIRGADQVIQAQKSISTKQVNLAERDESFTVSTQLVPTDGVELVGSRDVAVAVQVEEQLITRTYTDVAVSVRGDGWSAMPAHIEVTLTGTTLAVERAKADLALFVRVSPSDKASRVADVVVEGLPPGVGVKLSPERVKLVPAVIRQ